MRIKHNNSKLILPFTYILILLFGCWYSNSEEKSWHNYSTRTRSQTPKSPVAFNHCIRVARLSQAKKTRSTHEKRQISWKKAKKNTI